MRKICPRCGANSDKKRFIGLFCEDCYAERLDVGIKSRVMVEVCRKCGRMRLGKDWVPPTRSNLERLLRRAVEGKYENIRFVVPQSGEGESQAVFLVRAGDDFVEAVRQFNISRHQTICEDDSRASAGYFEAVVQIRCSDPGKSRRIAERIKSEVSHKSFVSRFEEHRRGFDIYIGSNRAAMEALKRLGLRAERSATLHGVKEGQRVYRITYCVRD